MRVGLTLFGDHLSEDGARYASQLGVGDVVVHLTQYARNADNSAYRNGGVGPINGECIDMPLWTYEHMADTVAMLARHGLKVAAMENLSPNFWSDILLDGPKKHEQMDGLKQLVRDAGRAGIPVIGYNFSIAGVWGWQRKRVARGGAMTAVFFGDEFDTGDPIPDGMLWNMRYRHPVAGAAPISVSERDLWSRLEWFLKELVPVAEKANVRLAAHPDDPPVERLRGNARLVNAHAKYQRLLDIAPSPANALEFCIGSLQEMVDGDVYETTRHFARLGAIAYVHFRNVRGKVPHYVETFVDDGDVEMAEIVRVLRDEGFDGVMVPDHVPDLDCPAPWHAGNAYTIGFMKALTMNADALGPARSQNVADFGRGRQAAASR
ncbi:mannonate dehydratase [Neorhizobium tomejilense]|uniref:mannonate dehydratase n=1 Tax=Neorhizobium tomejilense TaxID=2093828 RepID=UPI003ED124EA